MGFGEPASFGEPVSALESDVRGDGKSSRRALSGTDVVMPAPFRSADSAATLPVRRQILSWGVYHAASTVGPVTSRPDRPIGVAAGAAVASLLRGPTRTGTVIGSFSAATVIGVDTPAGPRVVTLLAPGASGTPHGVRMPGPLGSDRTADRVRDRAGDRVTLGNDRVVHRGHERRIVRYWPTAIPLVQILPPAAQVLAHGLRDAPIGVPRSRVDDLAQALAAGDPSPAVRALLGVGAGLTPGGDDVLAGLLVGLRAAGRDVERAAIAAALGEDLPDRTTALSADLLRLAAAGHAMTPVLTLLGALHGQSSGAAPTPARIRTATAAVLEIGHTSGADLLTGLQLGLATSSPDLRISARLPVPAGSRKDPS